MANALDFQSGGRGFEPSIRRRVVSLDKKQVYKWVSAIIVSRGYLVME